MKIYDKLVDIQRDIRARSLTCSDLVAFYLENIHSQSDLNIFLEVFEEEAIAKAKEVDQKIQNGTAGRLAGLVIGIKDVICYKGHRLSASSKILENFESLFTSTALQRLLDEDAIVIGRQNCDEFAMGSSNENSAYGAVANPIDPERVPGGSSGASAAAVAARMCHASLGSDTGGSVRQPASFCGVVGLKPTYGRISRFGLIAYASSFDQIGVLSHSVEDAALLLEIMAGKDPNDQTTSAKSPKLNLVSTNKPKVGFLKECLESPALDPEIKSTCHQLLESFRKEGLEVKELSFPLLPSLVSTYYVLTTAEASSNLSRYDGIRYGHRNAQAASLEEVYTQTRTEALGAEVKRRIMLGTFVLSSGYYDAYYGRAQKVRRKIKEETHSMLDEVDLILSPVVPATAFKIGEKSEDPIEMYLSDIFTVHANLAGIPAISLPLGSHSNGLPFGVQLMGKAFDEETILSFSTKLMNK
ncbi:MAG: Asp-tRNA(Asn)/Glu-tRNA(Gln) amidotransferase subunit GatA [Bacteroidia bacterium]|nr:Asp-tRNA(Asn)/Glu-tRNA(Gln) amidotransferase subunit GatA [Bacteroidia bacterium]